jgi:dTDP-glucose 4,6-dehydratase
MNIFGERQHPEKFIPGTIRKVLKGETVIIHSNSDKTKPGSRFYIHARNVASGVLFVLDKGEFRQRYNIVGEKEVDNLQLAQMIAMVVGKELKYELVDFHSSRPGHDLRYALDGNKMKHIGWCPGMAFEQSLEKTVKWTLENDKWLQV